MEIRNANDKKRPTINEKKKPCQILVQCDREEISSTLALATMMGKRYKLEKIVKTGSSTQSKLVFLMCEMFRLKDKSRRFFF